MNLVYNEDGKWQPILFNTKLRNFMLQYIVYYRDVVHVLTVKQASNHVEHDFYMIKI